MPHAPFILLFWLVQMVAVSATIFQLLVLLLLTERQILGILNLTA
ncbi:hypothetical protein [Nostoc sp.]